MKRLNFILNPAAVLATVVLITGFVSCSSEIVPSPVIEALDGAISGSASTKLTAPEELTATQGEKRCIKLTWSEVNKAVRYYIYSAATPFNNFTQVAESTSASYTYDGLTAGTSKYFKVTAVDYAGTESDVSSTVLGSTLAQPIISDITGTSGSEDTSVTVYWYMENANASTYLSSVCYTITCTDSSGKAIAAATVKGTDISETAYTFSDLTPNKTYLYTVTAYLSTAENNMEKSDAVNAETARRLRPDAPTELIASQGTDKTGITLSFTLPEKVFVLISSGTYSQYPLYFKIYRRPAAADGETPAGWGDAIVDHLYFNGTTTAPGDYDSYTAGSTVTWTNSAGTGSIDIKRGTKYDYKIQSYADTVSRVITSDFSVGTVSGWAMAAPALAVRNCTSVPDDAANPAKYISASLGFTASWESFGTESNYKFIVKISKADTVDATATADSYMLYDSISAVNAATLSYELPDDSGYYSYALYVVGTDTSGTATQDDLKTAAGNAYDSVTASDVILLTDSITQPDLSSFAAAGGCSNKCILSWKKENGYTYTLNRYTVDSNGDKTDSKIISVDTSGTETGKTVEYTDSDGITSGVKYIYLLYAAAGSATFPSKALTVETLGTPTVTFETDRLAYDSITVSWPEVQQAASYIVSLARNGTSVGNKITINASDLSATAGVSESEGIITLKMSDPAGYNDAVLSGKDCMLTLTAVGAAAVPDSTSGTATVRTMGPAATGITATQSAAASHITVTWNKIAGAAGYTVQRVRYNVPSGGSETAQKKDIFYVADDGTITYNSSPVSGPAVIISGSTYILTDNQKSVTDSTAGYQKSQSMISWGVPFDYTILPVLTSDDASDTDDFQVAYSNLPAVTARGSTSGYGQNITAGKAASASSITITWNAPCGAVANNKIPYIYYREAGSDGSWTSLASAGAGDTSCTYSLSSDVCKAYEYAVSYNNNGTFVTSYTDDLASKTDSNGEQENKGYEFTLPYFAAVKPTSTSETWGETVSWTLYDTAERKRGPEKYTIYSKNLNCSGDWWPIASIAADGTITTLPDYKEWYDVSIKKGSNNLSLTVAPLLSTGSETATGEKITENAIRLKRSGGTSSEATTGVHDGLLKVQRDYKHYYKLEATRDSGGVTAELGDDDSVYTYRKISDDEFVRCVTLILADSVHQIGGSEGSLSGSSGSFSTAYTYNWGIPAYYYYRYTITSPYYHIFKKIPGSTSTLPSEFYLSASQSDKGCANSNKIYEWDWGTITVNHQTKLPSYTGTVYLYAGQDKTSTAYNLCLQYTHKTGNISDSDKFVITDLPDSSYNTSYDNTYTAASNQTAFEKWFPFCLGQELSSGDGYNTSYPSCNKIWWEVRTK
jgi:hypothetical protein